ncbi:MAG TPA: integrase [Xanthobacteraceae bacterium]|nr:integrase [Xanthobacteraceae bacterium]
MVELPRYVKPIRKANGRVFYYFMKYRGTADAWPAVPLHFPPGCTEFVQRTAICQSLLAERTAAEWRWHLVDASQRRHALPSPTDPAFWDAAIRADDLGRKMDAGEAKTFSGLIMAFREGAIYQHDLATSTRAQYDRFLDLIQETWGDDVVADLTPVDAQQAIDSMSATPGSARYFRSVLSRLIKWGIPRGYRLDNPVEHTEKIDSGGTWDPWPAWAFELFFEHARVGLHLPVYSGLFTGQRSVDIMNMRRPLDRATEMPVLAQKTGEIVPVQIHSEYRLIIAAAKTDNLMLHLREDGVPWTLAGFRTAWQRELTFTVEPGAEQALVEKAAAMKRIRDAGLVFHGLRKNAVCMLLEVGCSEDYAGAIVGMSPQMVRHYSKQISKFRLARSAMKQLESGWSDIRQNVLGSVSKPPISGPR